MQRFFVIGITDQPNPWFPPEVLEVIKAGKVFSGGKRHHEIVAPLLPEGAEWIDITVPLDSVFSRYAACPTESIVVFASGDPLFFGFANTIKRKMPEAEIAVYPSFNSLQLLAHRLVMPYHDLRIVSLTGRPWMEFDRALIERAPKIGVLTDREHTPATIAQRMMDYGYNNYQMYVGEHLGNPSCEKVSQLTLEEAANGEYEMPNCLILNGCGDMSPRHFGISEKAFALLDGREKMITKAPIRLLTLSALELQNKHSFWDIGFCTGSVSIEARLLFPHLRITAFEIREEGRQLMLTNSRRFGAPGIETVIGDFLSLPFSQTLKPDAIFIGGHGGRLPEMMRKAIDWLLPGGVIVYNCVSPDAVTDPRIRTDSRQLFEQTARECGLRLEPALHVAVNDHHPIDILKARKQ